MEGAGGERGQCEKFKETLFHWRPSLAQSISLKRYGSFYPRNGLLRGLVAELNPHVPVTRVRALESVIANSTAAPRSLTLLLSAFGGLAILVGGIGVYSLISYTVSWRTREIGLRLALGANRVQIAKLVLGQSLWLAMAGSALGIGGAVAATRLMSRFLFETSPTDPLTYSLVPVLFCGLALMAAWAPARRAARVGPMVALRDE